MGDSSMKSLFSRENAGLWIFAGIAILVAVILAVFVSPWASSSPDGLEKKAEEKGFMEKAEEREPAWKHSPMPDYTVESIKNERVSTGVSGLIGVILTLVVAVAVGLIALGIGKLTGRRSPEPRT